MKSNVLNKILFVFVFIFLINGIFADPEISSITSSSSHDGVLGIGDKIEFYVKLTEPMIDATVIPNNYNGGELTWISQDDGQVYVAAYEVEEGQPNQTDFLQLTDVMARNEELKTLALSGEDVRNTIDATSPIVTDLVLDIINTKNVREYILSINLETDEKDGLIRYEIIDSGKNIISGEREINELLQISQGKMPLSLKVDDLSSLVDGDITVNIEVIDVAENKTEISKDTQKITVLPELEKVNLYSINLKNQDSYNLEIVANLDLTDWLINLEIFNFNTTESVYLISKTSKKISDTGYSLSEDIDLSKLAEGKYKFKVTITDSFGNTSKEFEQNILKDTINPTLILDNSTPIKYNKKDLKIKGTIQDKLNETIKVKYRVPSTTDLKDCLVNYSPSDVVGYNYVTCDINGLNDGNYNILIQSEDSSLNQQDIYISVVIDTFPVSLEINDGNRLVKNSNNYPKQITGAITLNPIAISTVNAYLSPLRYVPANSYRKYTVIPTDLGKFTIDLNDSVSGTQPEIPLADGEYLLRVILKDNFGNTVLKTQKIIIDSIAPETTIDELTTTDRTPIISGKTTSGLALTNEVKVIINNRTYNAVIDGNNWSAQVTENMPIDVLDVKVIATDEAENTAEPVTRTVTVTPAPATGGGGGARITPVVIPQPVVTTTTEVIPRPEPFIAPANPATPVNNAGTTPATETPVAEELAPAATEIPATAGATGFLGLPGNTARNVGVGVGALAVIGAVGYFFFLRPR
ncbi:MAG: Ig-like domain-containing protein [archaeon]|jgi:hypothetical protein